jgi:hypothetical protein
LDLDLTRERSPELPYPLIQVPQPGHDLLQDRQWVRRGVSRVQLGKLVGGLDRLAKPLEAFLRRDALRGEPLSLASLF